MEIKQLKLFSKDVTAQFNFYKNVLGFDVTFNHDNTISFQAGKTQLIFEENLQNNFIYHFAFLIPNEKIEEAIPFLENKGIKLLNRNGEKIIYFGTKESYTGRAIYFYDEDGNIGEFIERPSLGHNSSETFHLQQIIKINEIGLPVDMPLEFSQQLISKFNIQLIDPNHLTEKFCWVGDYDGVFIVVKNGRHWLPTQLSAAFTDCWIKFESSGKQYELEFKNGKVS